MSPSHHDQRPLCHCFCFYYLVVLALAAYYPRSWMLTLTQGVMFSLAGVVLLCVISDCWRGGCFSQCPSPSPYPGSQPIGSDSWAVRANRQRQTYDYRRNIAYTALLVIISLAMLPVLYLKVWYPALLQDVIQSSTNTVVGCLLGQDW
jgi:hypothetical protein